MATTLTEAKVRRELKRQSAQEYEPLVRRIYGLYNLPREKQREINACLSCPMEKCKQGSMDCKLNQLIEANREIPTYDLIDDIRHRIRMNPVRGSR